jgi:hypothetical protein
MMMMMMMMMMLLVGAVGMDEKFIDCRCCSMSEAGSCSMYTPDSGCGRSTHKMSLTIARMAGSKVVPETGSVSAQKGWAELCGEALCLTKCDPTTSYTSSGQ